MSVAQALIDLEKEITDRICGITPNVKVKQNATFTPYKAKGTKSITEFTGLSRTFAVGPAVLKDPLYQVGYNSRHETHILDVTIVYKKTNEMMAAAADDIGAISNNFNVDPLVSTNSHVAHFSVFDSDQPKPNYTEHPSEPWVYYRLIVRAYISVTP